MRAGSVHAQDGFLLPRQKAKPSKAGIQHNMHRYAYPGAQRFPFEQGRGLRAVHTGRQLIRRHRTCLFRRHRRRQHQNRHADICRPQCGGFLRLHDREHGYPLFNENLCRRNKARTISVAFDHPDDRYAIHRFPQQCNIVTNPSGIGYIACHTGIPFLPFVCLEEVYPGDGQGIISRM